MDAGWQPNAGEHTKRPGHPGIEELLGGKQIEYPPAAQTNVTHKKAPKAKLVSSLERKAQEYARNKAA